MNQSTVLSILHQEYVDLCIQLEANEAAGLPVIELARRVAQARQELEFATQRIGSQQKECQREI